MRHPASSFAVAECRGRALERNRRLGRRDLEGDAGGVERFGRIREEFQISMQRAATEVSVDSGRRRHVAVSSRAIGNEEVGDLKRPRDIQLGAHDALDGAAPAGVVHGCQLQRVAAAFDDGRAEIALRVTDTLRNRRSFYPVDSRRAGGRNRRARSRARDLRLWLVLARFPPR